MRAGELDRRITLLKPGTTIDPLYGPQPGDDTVFASRISARKWDDKPGDTETTEGGLRMSGYPATVRIRYRKGVTSDMRVILHGDTDQVYEITSTPAEIGRREWLEFTIQGYSS